MTKKAAALLLAASLAVSVCATPVFAAGNRPYNNGQTVQDSNIGEDVVTVTTQKHACTQLKYNVTEGYTWSIPADINFGSDHGVSNRTNDNYIELYGDVAVKDCKLKNGYTLKISMHGNDGQYNTDPGNFKVKTEEGAELGYVVNINRNDGHGLQPDLTPGGEILSLAAGTNKAKTTLKFLLDTYNDDDNAAEKAGVYIGYAIFLAQATKN